MSIEIPEPWNSFLREVDDALESSIETHCLGGFVLTVLWNLPRPTGDIDVVEAIGRGSSQELLRIGGEGSALASRYHLKFDRVTVAEYPEGYRSRLIDLARDSFRMLRLRGFEAHDLALSKLTRNIQRDREDVAFLAHKGVIDAQTLTERFEAELKPYLLNPQPAAIALQLWIDEYFSGR